MPVSRKRLSLILQTSFRKNLVGKIVVRSLDDLGEGKTRNSYRLHLHRKQAGKHSIGWRSMLARSESGMEGGQYAEFALYSRMDKLRLDFSIGIFDISS